MRIPKLRTVNWRKPIIFLLLHATGSRIPRYLKEIRRIAQLPDDDKREYQEMKLRALLLHAWRNVPYYSRVLREAGVVRDGVVHLENFGKIPILTRDIIRREGSNLYSRDRKKRHCRKNASGGSTGEPVQFIQDKDHAEWATATRLYQRSVMGQDVGEREVRMRYHRSESGEGREGRISRLATVLRNRLYNRLDLSAFRLSVELARGFARECNAFKPTYIFGYSFSLFEFAKLLRDSGMRIFSPRGILTTAGPLYPEMKRTIGKVFSCPVYTAYGSREFDLIAFGEGSLDHCYWNNKVEVLDDHGTDARHGRIIVTGLNNYVMPFVRYDTGDIGAVDRPSFVLEKIDGRLINYFRKENGEKILGYVFAVPFFDKRWCKNFRIVQTDYDRIEIEVAGQKDGADWSQIERAIKDAMGRSCKVTFSIVSDLPPTGDGKHMHVISRVS